MEFESSDDLARAQSDPYDFEWYREFDFVAHQIDLATEGIRQVREMQQHEALEVLAKYVGGDVNDFIGLHTHLFHVYDGIDTGILWVVLRHDVPMMITALESAIAELEQ